MQLHNCSISAHGNIFTFELDDGKKIVKEFPFTIPALFKPSDNALFSLAAALLITTERIEKLEIDLRWLQSDLLCLQNKTETSYD